MPPARQMAGAAFAGAQFLGDREPHAGRDLLGAMEIFVRGVFERAAVERDQSLVAAGVGPLVDGHGEVAFAEQGAAVGRVVGDRRRDARLVETRAGAHLAGRGEVHHQHAHRAVALRLQDEAALDLERRAEHDGEHHRLAQELGDRRRIGVLLQDLVHHRPEPHHAAAQIELGHFERHHGVVGGGGRRRAGGDFDIRCVHAPYLARERRNARAEQARAYASACRHQASRPFWACRRFSASSNTTDCGPSITSSVTSWPRWAGRQCMNSASGLALLISRALTW